MSKIKIFNDPIYGLVNFPFEFVYDLIDHPYVQRLRRIRQLGLSTLVYPGATHSRFHHALGALHLCDRLINNLRLKGVHISEEEHEAVLCATLLHDIGHGPFSHALEGELLPVHHEVLTLEIMKNLDEEFNGRLSLAIALFEKKYQRRFLSQIISGQLDVDRMDYLNRDSFYTGVAEGIIGYDRLIKMMNVVDDELVMEEKGIYSIEKFLFSRHFMFQQVYHHHAALAADHMLKTFFSYYKSSAFLKDRPIDRLIAHDTDKKDYLPLFLSIDDSDVIMLLKQCMSIDDSILRTYSSGIINRRIFAIKTMGKPLEDSEIDELALLEAKKRQVDVEVYRKYVHTGTEMSELYTYEDEIKVLTKSDQKVVTFGQISRLNSYRTEKDIYFVTYPKHIGQ